MPQAPVETRRAEGTLVVQAARFGTVGVLCFLLALVLYAALLEMGVPYVAAGTIGYVGGVAAGFGLNRSWTFPAGGRAVRSQVVRYLAVNLTAISANAWLLHLLVASLGVREVVAEVLAMASIAPLTFTANRWWTFSRR